jgi:hypothetical protein
MTANERIARLEAAVALAYVHHGPNGVKALAREAPAAAQLLHEWMNRTEPIDNTFVGRRETADPAPRERRSR